MITYLDFSNAARPGCIPLVVLKNCGPEISCILAELFNLYLKESYFLGWKVSLVFFVFKNIREMTTAENYHPVSLLSVFNKVFEKLLNNRLADHLEKCGLFCHFQHGFRSSWSTANLLTVASDWIARAFNRSEASQAVAFDISKTFHRVWEAGLIDKRKSYGILG